VAIATKPDTGKPRDLADTVCFKRGKRGHVSAKCLSNSMQGSNSSNSSNNFADNENAKKAGRTFCCSVSAFKPNEQSDCGQSTGVTHIESPDTAQAAGHVVSTSPGSGWRAAQSLTVIRR